MARKLNHLIGCVVGLTLGVPSGVEAFCGVYVGAAGIDLYNESSQVAIARVEDQTRLVEYMEKDPCARETRWHDAVLDRAVTKSAPRRKVRAAPPQVRVVRTYNGDEYKISILSADESTALERWLKTQRR